MPSLCPEKAETTPHKASPASILVPAAGAFARHLAPADANRASGLTHRLASHATCVIYPNRSPEWVYHHNAPAPVAPTTQDQENPLEALGALLSPPSTGIPGNPGNAGNAWMGWLAYDLAASIESGILARSTDSPDPLAMLQRVDLASHTPQTPPPDPHAPPRTVLRSSQGREAYKRATAMDDEAAVTGCARGQGARRAGWVPPAGGADTARAEIRSCGSHHGGPGVSRLQLRSPVTMLRRMRAIGRTAERGEETPWRC